MPNPYSFAVIGVIVSSISANSLAVFDDGTCLHVGGRYRDLVVSQIEYRWVTFRRDEYVARVMVGDPSPFAQRAELETHSTDDGGRRTILTDAYKRELTSPLALARALFQIGAEPYPGGGFRVFGVEPGSIFDTIGLKDEDIVDSINGFELKDPSGAVKILRHLSDETRYIINVWRGLDQLTLVVEIR